MKGFNRALTLWDGTNLTVAATGVTPKGMANLLTRGRGHTPHTLTLYLAHRPRSAL